MAQAATPATQPVLAYLSSFCIVQAMTTDAAGNLYVAGQTISNSFPTVNPIQGPSGVYPDAIVAKIDSTGTQLLYSTYLGGNWSSVATGIAVDAAGSAYVTGWTGASNFPVTISPTPSNSCYGPSCSRTFALKISPDGSKLLYSELLGGTNSASRGNAIAVDGDGNAYVAGSNNGTDFPTVNALQPLTRTNPLFVTSNAGATFSTLNFPVPVLAVYGLAYDPENVTTMFAATYSGLFKSTNAGATWRLVYVPPPIPGITPVATAVVRVLVDPRNSANVYAAGGSWGIAKSTDGGETFSMINNGIASLYLGYGFTALSMDPANSSVLWATGIDAIFRTADGGQDWQMVLDTRTIQASLLPTAPARILPDPNNSSRVYICCAGSPATESPLLVSTDNGQTWGFASGTVPYSGFEQAAIDPRNASVIYVAAYYNVLRSADGGKTWAALAPTVTAPYQNAYMDVQVDANGNIYALTANSQILRSNDAGQTWTTVSQGPWAPTETMPHFLGFKPGDPSTFSVGVTGNYQDAFALKLDPNGQTLWSTLLGGTGVDQAQSIALDSAGNVYVGGATSSPDFPTVKPIQTWQGGEDAFISKVSSDGTKLMYSTYLGGSGDDSIVGLGVDPTGAAYVAGNTTSYTGSGFPTVNALQASPGDMFLAKLNPAGSALAYSTYLGTADSVNALAVDSQGGLYFSGATRSNDFPTVNAFNTSGPAGYVAKLDPSGLTLDFSSYLLETDNPALALALSPSGSLWFGGRFVATPQEPVGSDFGAAGEGFVGRIDFLPPAVNGVPQVHSITDAASFREGDVFAPGSIVSIFGSGLADGVGQAAGAPLTDSLQGTTVLVGGIAAPLFYVSGSQINLQIPVGLPTGETTLVVQRDRQPGTPWPLAIVAAMPGIFTQTMNGTGAGIIAHASDFSLVTAANPAVVGEYLAIFCTGLGATQPVVASGYGAGGSAQATANPILVNASFGATYPVQYAGLAPGWPGLYQVNFQLTSGLPSRYSSTGITLTVGNIQSNTVTLYLAQ